MFERAYHSIHANENIGIAIMEGKVEEVKRELDNGADVNHTPHDAPLVMIAAIYKHWPVVDVLLDHGADINARNKFNLRLLNLLAKDGPKELIEKVVSMGALINTRDNDLETPFLVAVKNNRHDVVDYFLDIVGTDITSKDIDGKTSLHHCAQMGKSHYDMFMKLWYQGVEISTQDNSGKTASEYIQDQDWLDELPEFEKTIIENKKEEAIAAAPTEEEKEKVVDTLKATGISSIKRRPKK